MSKGLLVNQTLGQHLHQTGNPVIPIYAADPDAALFGDKYFIYATDAGVYAAGEFQEGRKPSVGHGFAAWSSSDLCHWQSEGIILRFGDVSWARELSNAWAPCIAERNGKYYFYFCADSRIGVAVSESPTGPFVDAKGEPLVPYRDDLSAIDPMVFTDDDGQTYCYWGAVPGFWLEGKIDYVRMHLSVQKLAPDMVNFVGDEMPTIFTQRLRESWHDLDHIEASHVTKRDDTYYLQWSQGNFGSDDEAHAYRVNYATALTPLGPWHHANLDPMLSTHRAISAIGPGHHSVIQIPGTDEWYCVYHNHKGDADRRVCIDAMHFDENGRIRPVLPTLEGPPARPVRAALKLHGFGPFPAHSTIAFEAWAPFEDEFISWEFFDGPHLIGTCRSGRFVLSEARTGFYRISARGTTADGHIATTAHFNLDVI